MAKYYGSNFMRLCTVNVNVEWKTVEKAEHESIYIEVLDSRDRNGSTFIWKTRKNSKNRLSLVFLTQHTERWSRIRIEDDSVVRFLNREERERERKSEWGRMTTTLLFASCWVTIFLIICARSGDQYKSWAISNTINALESTEKTRSWLEFPILKDSWNDEIGTADMQTFWLDGI